MSVYWEHAATSFPKPVVVCCRMNEGICRIAANSERSGRGGWHRAPQAHRTIGTFPLGTVRASLGLFNTPEDVEALAKAIREITRMQDTL